MRYYCTLFDSNYLPNFLALYHSLIHNDHQFKIYAFCMDDKSYDYLITYPQSINAEINCIHLDQLYKEFAILKKIKQERSIVEFYFTCSSFISSYLINNQPTANYVTYLDADLLFFDSPEKIFEEIGQSSVGIIAHKFFGRGKRYLKYGIYNVGWVTFKNDKSGRDCLNSWKDNCKEWCYDYYDEANKRFGDQKYLDYWERDYKGVKVIEHKGANVAPWNVGQYNLSVCDDKLYIDEESLIFYHFASFKKVKPNVYTTNLSLYLSRPSALLKKAVYKFYLDRVSKYANLIDKEATSQADLMKKNRFAVKQTFKQKIRKVFTLAIRWYFNDYVYK